MSQTTVAKNRKAFYQYEILERIEVGIVLLGTEVKSIREGQINLKDSYAQFERGELWLHQAHISPYHNSAYFNHEPLRPRKLLLHKRELRKWLGKIKEKRFTLVPIQVYWKGKHLKVELGLARGKRLYEKKEVIQEREVRRSVDRMLKTKQYE